MNVSTYRKNSRVSLLIRRRACDKMGCRRIPSLDFANSDVPFCARQINVRPGQDRRTNTSYTTFRMRLFSLSLTWNAHLLGEVDPDEESPTCDDLVNLRLHQRIMNGLIGVITPTYQLSKAFRLSSSTHRRTRLWAIVRLCLNVPRATPPTKVGICAGPRRESITHREVG